MPRKQHVVSVFLLDIEGAHQTGEDKKKTWYDLGNIYSREELSSMDNNKRYYYE